MRNRTALCNPTQNPVPDKIQSEKITFQKNKFVGKKNLTRILSRTDSKQSELSRANRCLSSRNNVHLSVFCVK